VCLSHRYADTKKGGKVKLKKETPGGNRGFHTRTPSEEATLLYKSSTDVPVCQAPSLKEVWGTWLTELGDSVGGWDWWATLTFREPPEDRPGWNKIGWGYSGRAWDRFIKELGLTKGLSDINWVRGREYQRWRGVPHFHALIGGVKDIRRMDFVDWWFDRYGIARILPYDRNLGAGFYLCKYVVKELGDIQFSGGLTKVE